MSLTTEQKTTLRELRKEIKALDLQADEQWAKYIQTGDEECYEQVLALDSEAAMMSAVAYVPKKGEHHVGRMRNLIGKLKGHTLVAREETEARLQALESINAWRDSYGLTPLERLPMGIPGDSSRCTLAMAFRMSVKELGATDQGISVTGSDSITVSWQNADGTWETVHPGVRMSEAVISHFDGGRYLDLIENLEPIIQERWGEYRDEVYDPCLDEPLAERERIGNMIDFLDRDKFKEVVDEAERRGEGFTWTVSVGGWGMVWIGPGPMPSEHITLDQYKAQLAEALNSELA